MKKQTIWLCSVLLVILSNYSLFVINGVCQDEAQVLKLTRYQAIAMAIRNNIDLRVRALDSSLVETDIQGGMSIYNPNLTLATSFSQTEAAGETYGTQTLSGTIGVSQKLSTGGTVSVSAWTSPTSDKSDPQYDYTDWYSTVGLTVYQPLLKNAGKQATELGINQDKYAYEGSLEDFRDDVIETTFSVIREYNRLYVLYQLKESRQEALDSAQRLLDAIDARADSDGKSVDLANAEFSKSQRQTAFIEASREVNSKEAKLRYLIGIEHKANIIPIDPPSIQEPLETEAEAIELAYQQRPDLEGLRIQLESSELRRRVAERDLWPDLALTGTAGFRGYAEDGSFSDTTSQISDGKGAYWSAGVSLRFPLGNDLAESRYRRDKLRSEQLSAQITAAEWKIRDEIQEDNRSLISARLQMRETKRSKLFAERRVAKYVESARLGSASVKDLLDAENDLINARNLELNAIEDFAYLVALLWKDIGVLLDRQNIHIDTTRPQEITRGGSLTSFSDEKPPADGGETPVIDSTPSPEAEQTPASPEEKKPKETAVPPVSAAEPVKPKAVVLPTPVNSIVNDSGSTATVSSAPETASYTLKIGEFLESEVTSVKKKIEQSGLTPMVRNGLKQERVVFRLLAGTYEGYSKAKKALESLEKIHRSVFILKNSADGYDAYAGSFFTLEGAETEQKRLAARGISVSVKKVSVSLPAFLVTAGPFSSRQAAMAGAEKLKQQGLKAVILKS